MAGMIGLPEGMDTGDEAEAEAWFSTAATAEALSGADPRAPGASLCVFAWTAAGATAAPLRPPSLTAPSVSSTPTLLIPEEREYEDIRGKEALLSLTPRPTASATLPTLDPSLLEVIEGVDTAMEAGRAAEPRDMIEANILPMPPIPPSPRGGTLPILRGLEVTDDSRYNDSREDIAERRDWSSLLPRGASLPVAAGSP